MPDDARHHLIAERILRTLDALAGIAGFGRVSTVLFEFEAASVAVVRDAGGTGHLIRGRPLAAASEVRLKARKRGRSGAQTGSARSDVDNRQRQEQMRHGRSTDDLEVAVASLQPAGQAVTATVELVHGGRRVVAKSTGRNAAERHLFLMAEAAARAVTEFLPPGYGVILGEIHSLPEELGGALRAGVVFMTPTEDRALEGVAPVADRPETAAARTVLAAVHDHVIPLLSYARSSR